MKKIIITLLLICVLGGMSAQNDADTAGLHNYKHSVGIDLAWMYGVSWKYNMINNWYLQTDLGVTFWGLEIPITLDVGGRLFVFYEDLFSKRTNTYWIVGGGVGLGAVPHTLGGKEASLKGSAQTLLGIEFNPRNTHLSFQFDARLGYGIIYSTEGVEPSGRLGFVSNANPYHYFDFAFVASIRFFFCKKN